MPINEFKENIESYRRRLIIELTTLNANIDGFVDSRMNNYEHRHLIQKFRGSLEKCNMYVSYIEEIVEKRIKDANKQTSI